jgi:hypothetical protein
MSEKKDEVTQVGDIDPNKKTSPIVESSENGDTSTNAERGTCWFNGLQYGPGARVCSGGSMLKCYSNGSWSRIGSC